MPPKQDKEKKEKKEKKETSATQKEKQVAAASKADGVTYVTPNAALSATVIPKLQPSTRVIYVLKVTKEMVDNGWKRVLWSTRIAVDSAFSELVEGDIILITVHTALSVPMKSGSTEYQPVAMRHIQHASPGFLISLSRAKAVYGMFGDDDKLSKTVQGVLFDDKPLPKELLMKSIKETRTILRYPTAAEINEVPAFKLRGKDAGIFYDTKDKENLAKIREGFKKTDKDLHGLLKLIKSRDLLEEGDDDSTDKKKGKGKPKSKEAASSKPTASNAGASGSGASKSKKKASSSKADETPSTPKKKDVLQPSGHGSPSPGGAGGYTALALAREHPHLVQSLFISGVEDLQTAWPWWKLRLAFLQHLPFYIVPKAVHIGHMQYMGMKGMNSDLYNAMKRAGNATGQNFADLVNMRLPPASQPMEWQLPIPTLALAGDKNDSVPTTQALADELAKGNPRSHLVVIHGGVHWWGLQYPKLFTKLVHDWLQEKDIPSHIDPSSFLDRSRTDPR